MFDLLIVFSLLFKILLTESVQLETPNSIIFSLFMRFISKKLSCVISSAFSLYHQSFQAHILICILNLRFKYVLYISLNLPLKKN